VLIAADPNVLSIPQAAQRLGISKDLACKLAREGSYLARSASVVVGE
jgi:hypothetical protein